MNIEIDYSFKSLNLNKIILFLFIIIGVFAFMPSQVDAAIQQRGSVTTCTATTLSAACNLSKPTGVAAGDLLVAWFCMDASTGSVTSVPSGWTQIGNSLVSGGMACEAYYIVAGGSEPSTYNWSLTGGGSFVNKLGQIIAFYGDSELEFDTHATTTGSSTNPLTLPGITTTAPNAMLVGLYANDTSTSASCWGSFTSPLSLSDNHAASSLSQAIASGVQTSAGSSGNKSGTCSTAGAGAGALLSIKESGGGGSQTFDTSGSWTAPANVYEVTVACLGAGGGGYSASAAGRGGGGGAFAAGVVSVNPGNNYSVDIGTGGIPNSAGGQSYFINTSTIRAAGGAAGAAISGGTGGTVANSVGTVRYAGGNAGDRQSSLSSGGGGGGSATASGTGGNGAAGASGIGGAGGSGEGNGGKGGNTGGSGDNGLAPGGGGGGGGSSGGSGGSGADGRCILTWEVSQGTPTPTPSPTPSNTAPTLTAGPSVSYGSFTRTGPSNTPFTVSFTATDSQQTGANQLNYQIRTAAGTGGTLVASGTFTSGTQRQVSIAYNASGMVNGSNTLYLRIDDGSLVSGSNPSFSVLRDDNNPGTAGSISTTPSSVSTETKQYTVTFTPNDAISTSSNEIRYQIRTGTGGGGTLLYPGSNFDTSTHNSEKTTGTITDSTLTSGSNTRYIRQCDGANNCSDTSFTVTGITPPTVATLAVSNLFPNSVTLNAQANPNEAATTGYFRYWTSNPGSCTDSGGTRVPVSSGTSLGSGSSNVVYSQNVTGLTSGTVIYYCAIADSGAKGFGSLVSFTMPGGGTCASVPMSGSYTISNSCIFGGGVTTYDGVDEGTGTTNTGVITIRDGATLTMGTAQTIVSGSLAIDKNNGGGSMVKFSGGIWRKGGLWVPDSDGDGYPEVVGTTGQIFSATQPAGYMRRTAAYNVAADCDDNQANIYQNVTSLATDADQDGYYTGSGSTQCVGSTTTASSRTYYRDSSGNFSRIKTGGAGGAIAGSDCNDSNASIYQTVNVVTDVDQDGYKTSTAAGNQCLGPSTTVSSRTYYTSGSGYTWLSNSHVLGGGSTDCQDNPSGAVCAVTGGSASAASQTQINISWSVNSSGGSVPAITGYDLKWCSGASCTPSTTITNATSSYSHTGRTCGTTYRYIIVAKGSTGNTDSSILSATTNSCVSAPSVTTTSATSITATGATLRSSVNPNGGSTTITYRYGTSNVACGSLPTTVSYGSIGSGTSAVSPNSQAISGLTPGVTYYFCATATNSAGTTNGSVLNFTTSVSAPSVTTSAASSITTTGATLNSSVNPNGASTSITYRYGTSNVACASLPTTVSHGSIGSGTSAVSPNARSISGLTPGQIYYFCATATNSAGTTNGNVLNFTASKLANGSTCNAASECTSNNCYVDEDNDRYAPSSGTKTCRASSQLAGTDCYDKNSNARPNQTSYFTSTRGTSGQGNDSAGNTWNSYDYNCNGSQEKQYEYGGNTIPQSAWRQGFINDCHSGSSYIVPETSPLSCGQAGNVATNPSFQTTGYSNANCSGSLGDVMNLDSGTQACR